MEIEFIKLQKPEFVYMGGKLHPRGEATLHAGCDPAPGRFQAFECALVNFTLQANEERGHHGSNIHAAVGVAGASTVHPVDVSGFGSLPGIGLAAFCAGP
jgi:hypothetical protein